MKCTNCGRLDFESSEVCPRCGEPMPPGSGEHSSASREQPIVPAAKTPEPPAPGPLFSPPAATATEPEEEKKPLQTKPLEPDIREKEAALPAPPAPKPTVIPEPRPALERPVTPPPQAKSFEPAREETRPAKDTARESSAEKRKESGTWSSDSYKRASAGSSGSRPRPAVDDMYPPNDFVEKARGRTPPLITRPPIREGGKVVPESYQHDSATFSSELSTDWIEKYARTHVLRSPETASIGMRAWAFTIDWLLLTAMGVVILLAGRLVVTLLDGRQYAPFEMLKILAFPIGGVWFVVIMLYLTIFTAASGQTPGQLAMDLRVVGENGYPPPLPKALLRSLLYVLGLIPLGAGLWWVFIDEKRRTLHDLAAGSTVLSIAHKKNS